MKESRPATAMTRGGMLFLLSVCLAYAAAFVVDRETTLEALALAAGLLYRLLPVLVLVFLLMFVSNLLLNPDRVRAHVGEESGLKGWLLAVVAGILSAGPIYAWFALLRDLKDKGMRTALIAVFLYNRGIKLPLLPLMIHYFGTAYTLILAGYMTAFSLLNGILLEWLMKPEDRSRR